VFEEIVTPVGAREGVGEGLGEGEGVETGSGFEATPSEFDPFLTRSSQPLLPRTMNPKARPLEQSFTQFS
jgi:hypothetical protein